MDFLLLQCGIGNGKIILLKSSSTNENWIKWDIFKIYIYVTVILTFKKGLIIMKKADK